MISNEHICDYPLDEISTTEAGALLSVDPTTIIRWIRSGRLGGWQVGDRLRVSRAEVLALRVRVGRPKKPRR